MANNYVVGKGKVYFDPFDSGGAKTGERYLGNCPGVELSVETESLEHFSSESGIQEKDDEVLLRVVRNCVMTCDNISMANMELFVIGTLSDVTQVATPVAGEAINDVKQGRYYQLGATTSNPPGVRNVSAVTVTGHVLNTDYTLDAALGRIFIVEGGGITDGDDLTVDYTPAANTRQRVASASVTDIEGALRFIADNPKGDNKDFYGPKVSLRPNGSFNLIGDEWLSMQFTVEFLKTSDTVQALYIDGRAVA